MLGFHLCGKPEAGIYEQVREIGGCVTGPQHSADGSNSTFRPTIYQTHVWTVNDYKKRTTNDITNTASDMMFFFK